MSIFPTRILLATDGSDEARLATVGMGRRGAAENMTRRSREAVVAPSFRGCSCSMW